MGFGGAGTGGSPNQMAKDKAKKDAKKTASVEMGLGTDTMYNYSVTEGGTGPEKGGNNGGNQVVQSSTPKVPTVPEPVTPTIAEVSQSTATDADEYDLIKTKKKGRSMTTLTSSQGVTDDKLTLGKPSLLGS